MPMPYQIDQESLKNENLTPREHEILNLLLAGSVPKEIAYALNISYATVVDHQKNIYRKLEVNKINDLIIKYSKTDSVLQYKQIKQGTDVIPSGQEVTAVFSQWGIVKDEHHDTNIFFASNIENINGKNTETYTIHGKVSNKYHSYAGVAAFPDDSTLKAIKNAKYFSFTAFGDGNTYEALLSTTKGGKDAVYYFYGSEFKTEKGVISAFSYNIDELPDSPSYGKQTEPFNKNDIEIFHILFPYEGDFNLKIWDIRLFL